MQFIHEGAIRTGQGYFFAARADGEVGVQGIGGAGHAAILARSPDNQEFVRLDGHIAKRPFEGIGIAVGEAPAREVHGGIASIPDFHPVGIVAVFILNAGVVGREDLIDVKQGGRSFAGNQIGIVCAVMVVPGERLQGGIGVVGGGNCGGQHVIGARFAPVRRAERDGGRPVCAGARCRDKRGSGPVVEGIAHINFFAAAWGGGRLHGNDRLGVVQLMRNRKKGDWRKGRFLYNHAAGDAIIGIFHGEGVMAPASRVDGAVFAPRMGRFNFSQGQVVPEGPFVAPTVIRQLEIAVADVLRRLHGDAPHVIGGQCHGFIGPGVPAASESARVLSGGSEGEGRQGESCDE